MPSYCNKDIKVISTEAILVTLCQLWKWFCMLRKLWKPPSRKTYQNLRKIFVIAKPFFEVHSIITYDAEAYVVQNLILKLYLRSWSLHNLNCTHGILISLSPNFRYSYRLINSNDIFHYFCEGKIPKIKRLNQCVKLDQIICLFITMITKF